MALTRLYELVAEIAPCRTAVRANSRFVEDLGFDSVSLLELLVAIENEFRIPPLQEADTRTLRTVGELEELLVGKWGVERT